VRSRGANCQRQQCQYRESRSYRVRWTIVIVAYQWTFHDFLLLLFVLLSEAQGPGFIFHWRTTLPAVHQCEIPGAKVQFYFEATPEWRMDEKSRGGRRR
jgi:hypothetical protein